MPTNSHSNLIIKPSGRIISNVYWNGTQHRRSFSGGDALADATAYVEQLKSIIAHCRQRGIALPPSPPPPERRQPTASSPGAEENADRILSEIYGAQLPDVLKRMWQVFHTRHLEAEAVSRLDEGEGTELVTRTCAVWRKPDQVSAIAAEANRRAEAEPSYRRAADRHKCSA